MDLNAGRSWWELGGVEGAEGVGKYR